MLTNPKPSQLQGFYLLFSYFIENQKNLFHMDKHGLQREFKNKIDDAFKKIQELENKKDEVTGQAKEELNEKIKTLQSKKDKLDQHYEELQNSTEDKIENVKVQFEKSMVNFKEGFKEIQKAF